jgi:hypothetical protein
MTKITKKMGQTGSEPPKLGQFYKDISRHGSESLYIVAQMRDVFSLIDVQTGREYQAADEIEDIFADDREDFVLVSNVEIILS